MTDDVYHWLVERCLMLELQIAELKGLEVALPAIERRSLSDLDPPTPPATFKHPKYPKYPTQHRATADDIAQMRALKRCGLSNAQVGLRTGFSPRPVWHYTQDMLLEREVGAT